jgi:hypothetical protein
VRSRYEIADALLLSCSPALLLSCSPPVIPMGNSCFDRQARPSRLNAQLLLQLSRDVFI